MLMESFIASCYMVFLFFLVVMIPPIGATLSSVITSVVHNKLICIVLAALIYHYETDVVPRSASAKRHCWRANTIFTELGTYSTRAHRMYANTFWKLHKLMHKDMKYYLIKNHHLCQKINGKMKPRTDSFIQPLVWVVLVATLPAVLSMILLLHMVFWQYKYLFWFGGLLMLYIIICILTYNLCCMKR